MSRLKATYLRNESATVDNIVLNSDGTVGGELGTTLASKVNGSSGSTPPASPVTGQIFVDTDDNSIKVWSGSAWVDPSNGGVPALAASDVTGTTGSPTISTYSDSGISYTVYKFGGSGSITLGRAGLASIAVCGGGGSGGHGDAGGGGAGGLLLLDATNAYLPSGALTVTVGAGAPAAGTSGFGYCGSTSSLGTSFYGVGGGGGGRTASQPTRDGYGWPGGSGGGAGGTNGASGGSGVSGQGNAGGNNGGGGYGGGGGGAGSAGSNGSSSGNAAGGSGVSVTIISPAVTLAAGGTGDSTNSSPGNATANTGNGGTGTDASAGTGGAGGSGVVIIRVRS